MSQPRTVRRLLAVCLAALGLGLPLAAQPAGPPADVDESKPVTVTCEHIDSWTEGTVQVLFLRGAATIEQGLVRMRTNRCVIWLDDGAAERDKVLAITVYGEGQILLERSDRQERTDKVVLELRTRDEFRLKNHSQTTQNLTHDPFYQRAVAARQAAAASLSSKESGVLRAAVSKASMKNDGNSDVQQAVLATSQQAPGNKAEIVGDPRVTPAQFTRPAPSNAAAGGPLLQRFGSKGPRRIRISSGGSAGISGGSQRISPTEQALTLTGGVNVFVEDDQNVIDLRADRAVIYTQNADTQQFFSESREGEATNDHYEVYLEGHVEIRFGELTGPRAGLTRMMLADQAFYDVSRNVALIERGEVIIQQPGIPVPIHMRAQEIRQVAVDRFEATNAEIFASRLPSDPGFKVVVREASVEERRIQRPGLFGASSVNPAVGQPEAETQLYGTGQDVTLRAGDVPFFYAPYLRGDLADPLGPLEGVRFRHDRVFGTGVQLDWDIYELFGYEAPLNTKWLLETDYLSERGPAVGTDFRSHGNGLFGIPGAYCTSIKGYLIYDEAEVDILGRDPSRKPPVPDELRGRFQARHRQELSEHLTFLGQFAYLSDRNFLEEYYKREFDNDINQETFLYMKYQPSNWAVSILAEPNLRDWVNETEWLPRADGYLLGQSFFDRFTYFARGSAGYARFHPSSDGPVPGDPVIPSLELGRFDLWQELNMPFEAGPFKIVPYGILDLTYYTETLVDENVGRVYGGGGVRGSIPFTRIYPDACSELFYVNGIAHKIIFDADYRIVGSNVDMETLPELDRMDDDATDQSRRDLRTFRIINAVDPFLATSPIYDPRLYALRRGVDTAVDTLDDLQYFRFGARQRWQTKRGFPGREHIVDWMYLNTHATIFPESDRDNFGHLFGFLDYDYIWHIGDRTTLVSSGWMEPFDDGGRYFAIGLFLDRPERLRHYIGYRAIEPVGSHVATFSTSYLFSPKWAVTASTAYDFGETRNLGNHFAITRIGTDVAVTLGVTYEALRNNFGLTLEITPSLAPRFGEHRTPQFGGAFAGP